MGEVRRRVGGFLSVECFFIFLHHLKRLTFVCAKNVDLISSHFKPVSGCCSSAVCCHGFNGSFFFNQGVRTKKAER